MCVGCNEAYCSNKHAALLTDGACTLFYIAWCVQIQQILGLSGIVAILVAGVVTRSYTHRNLSSRQAQEYAGNFSHLNSQLKFCVTYSCGRSTLQMCCSAA
jgi:NhaP-type Na+/H+ or K+/H+ antiporter